jgi:hypothetical protein
VSICAVLPLNASTTKIVLPLNTSTTKTCLLPQVSRSLRQFIWKRDPAPPILVAFFLNLVSSASPYPQSIHLLNPLLEVFSYSECNSIESTCAKKVAMLWSRQN